ncbi:Hpt domain-containing protein [Taklimakanibacter lacteus]|uniref:Hpt domain-containing protein n=1 Tax=Taklimakanibacter lacteus TaxID=2268456 RepID=UPI000E672418
MLTIGVAEMGSGDTDPAIFDRAHLRQYTSGDENLERELLGLFLGQFTPIRTQLHAAAKADDWKLAAHTLKGSARSIGAPQIGAVAEKLELTGFTAPADSRAAVLAELDQAMAGFAAEAEKVLGAGG